MATEEQFDPAAVLGQVKRAVQAWPEPPEEVSTLESADVQRLTGDALSALSQATLGLTRAGLGDRLESYVLHALVTAALGRQRGVRAPGPGEEQDDAEESRQADAGGGSGKAGTGQVECPNCGHVF